MFKHISSNFTAERFNSIWGKISAKLFDLKDMEKLISDSISGNLTD